jgi:hypothetical protein
VTQRTGSANLPLHGGRVPAWLATRMAALARVIAEAIVHHYGRDQFLRRLSHPFWFQSFGAVMGMDWHSSGITTSVLGALKRGLAPVQTELGVYVCGGRGRHSRATPLELAQVGERTGLDGAALARTSRLVAKIDSAAVQDGYDLYLHGFIVSAEGHWSVVQQGMNTTSREARRYHWLSEGLRGFLDSPHAAIEGRNRGAIINLADARAERNRHAELALLQEGPERTIGWLRQLASRQGTLALDLFAESAPAAPNDMPAAALPHLAMPHHHDVRLADVVLPRLHATLAAAAERSPRDFCDLLLTPGVGARTVAALAYVAEVIHGAPARFADPARFSMAHGGKDRHPFPVPLRVYDATLRVLKDALAAAHLGQQDKLTAIRALDRQARALEQAANAMDSAGGVAGAGPVESFERFLAHERAHSAGYGGRSVFGVEQPERPERPQSQ